MLTPRVYSHLANLREHWRITAEANTLALAAMLPGERAEVAHYTRARAGLVCLTLAGLALIESQTAEARIDWANLALI